MIEKIKKFINSNNLISPEIETVFVAVSGGIDSCVLLDLLNKLKSEWGISVRILHFNHKTRGEESDRDEAFVVQLAKQYGLDIRLGRIEKNLKKFTETSLREERYRFFQKVLAANKKAVIATGHNRDDNIETFLMRMAKGSRLKGLMAIRPTRPGFIRPVLCFSRSEIELYARKEGIDHVDDASNATLFTQRNLLRHKIIPYLKNNLDANIDRNISRIIHNLSLYNELYEEKLREAVILSVKRSGKTILLNRKRYSNYNEAIKRGLLEYCISNVYPVNYKVSDRNYLIWNDFINNAQPGKKNSFLDNGMAVAERNQILFGEISENRSDSYMLDLKAPVAVNDHLTITITEVAASEVLISHDRNVEFIDGHRSGMPLTVRFWQKGDRFKPLGMNHRRKLSDFFIDLKLSTALKKEIPIVWTNDRIIWIAGYRIDDYFKITNSTKLFYKMELVKTI